MSVEKQLIWYDDQFLTRVNDFRDDYKLNMLCLACIMVASSTLGPVSDSLTWLPFPLLFYHRPGRKGLQRPPKLALDEENPFKFILF